MGRSDIFVITYGPVHYDAYSGTPHYEIFQAKSNTILESKPGAPHSAMKSIAD
jgi:hypothetical protein